jgi:hypothetical protein
MSPTWRLVPTRITQRHQLLIIGKATYNRATWPITGIVPASAPSGLIELTAGQHYSRFTLTASNHAVSSSAGVNSETKQFSPKTKKLYPLKRGAERIASRTIP